MWSLAQKVYDFIMLAEASRPFQAVTRQHFEFIANQIDRIENDMNWREKEKKRTKINRNSLFFYFIISFFPFKRILQHSRIKVDGESVCGVKCQQFRVHFKWTNKPNEPWKNSNWISNSFKLIKNYTNWQFNVRYLHWINEKWKL